MTTTYAGIDYSLGRSNQDSMAHYGVISVNSLASWVYDEMEPVYNPYCPKCANELTEDFSISLASDDLPCPHCEHTLSDGDQWADEADHWTIEADGYELHLTMDNLELMVLKSPVMINAQFCSPCFPGAGNLDNPCPSGPLTYALELDWFDDYSPAPYTEKDLIKV